MRIATLVAFLVLVFAALSTAAERDVRFHHDSGIVHYHRGKVVAVTTFTPYGGERIAIQGLNPRIALYMHRRTQALPKRIVLRFWDTLK
ncbi:MAG: hypothetical protein HY918_03685 [Candidatus Doudnabacteria bacterium]|nr:hypothetical protein [Candidatus Doudnabacteria bacterium]